MYFMGVLMKKQAREIVKKIQTTVNSRTGKENGTANLIIRLDGERVKVKVNAGDFYAPMEILSTYFPQVEFVEMEVEG